MNFKDVASVTVIIPCYRCSDTIPRAVASVAAQTTLPAEVVLVDDASGDCTLSTLYFLQSEYPAGWIKIVPLKNNGGPGTARNAGWSIATQSYIAFLDADDIWHPNKIKLQYEWMTKNSDLVLSGHKCAIFTSHVEEVFDQVDSVDSVEISKFKCCISNPFPTRTVMLRRDVIHRFEDGKRYCEDYLLWLKIILLGEPFVVFRERLAFSYKAEFGDGGLSARLWAMEKGELSCYQSLMKEGLITFSIYIFLVPFSLLRFCRRFVVAKIIRRLCFR